MRIAVTGASGRVGSAVVDRAISLGHAVVAVDRRHATDPAPGVEPVTVDVGDYDRLTAVLDGCDALVHLAAITAPGHLPDHVVHDANVIGSYHALRAAAEVGIRRVCQASSVNAIGGRFSRAARYDAFPVDETHPCYAEDPYSLSKWVCEQQADAIVRRFDVSIVSLRLHGVVHDRATAVRWAEHVPEGVVRQLWGYTTTTATADACLAAITSDVDGHEVCYVVAPDIAADEPTLELVRRHYPAVPLRGPLPGFTGLFDCSKAERLLGWIHPPADDLPLETP